MTGRTTIGGRIERKARLRWVPLDQMRVDREPAVTGLLGEQVEHPRADHHVLPQRHRAVLVDHHGGVAAHIDEPLTELFGVAHRRRQADNSDALR